MKRPEDLTVTPAQRAEFTRFMTGGRMNAYDAAVLSARACGRTVDPLDLYVYNMAVSGALLGPLHMLEVVTRNAIHRELMAHAGQEEWWARGTSVTLLERHYRRIGEFQDKVSRALDGGRPMVPDDVVAASDFGFWCGLLGRGAKGAGADYEQLWDDAIRRAFPNTRQRRNQVWQKYDALRNVRNRVSHHEHVFRGNINENLRTIVELVGFISLPLAQWVDDRSRVTAVVQRHPFTGSPVTHF